MDRVAFRIPEVPTIGYRELDPISAMPSIMMVIKPPKVVMWFSLNLLTIGHSDRFPMPSMPSITLIMREPMDIVLIV